MSKTEKIDLSKKPQIKDSLGAPLIPGDVILFVSAMSKNGYGLSSGVFLNHFDNGNGWKMRVRTYHRSWRGVDREIGDNSMIGNNGIAMGMVKIHDTNKYKSMPKGEFLRIKLAIKLRDELISNNKIKIPKKIISITKEEVVITDESDSTSVFDILSGLDAPTIKG
jgi:hypothetical protein